MTTKITAPAIRIKVTGRCNRTCEFCHEEGDMQSIQSISPDKQFFDCVMSLTKALGCERIMLTGGEPTIHPALLDIVGGLTADEISITSNGIRPLLAKTWKKLRSAGLSKVILSIHDASVDSFISLESKRRNATWGERGLAAQQQNLINISLAGIAARVNTVVYKSAQQALDVMTMLDGLHREYGIEMRLLNNLVDVERSKQDIAHACAHLEATEEASYRRAGSSNATTYWVAKNGIRFSTKVSYPYYLEAICRDCQIKSSCHEGYYGVRLEKRAGDYWVRLCIYKQSHDILMPWKSFLDSELASHVREACDDELS